MNYYFRVKKVIDKLGKEIIRRNNIIRELENINNKLENGEINKEIEKQKNKITGLIEKIEKLENEIND